MFRGDEAVDGVVEGEFGGVDGGALGMFICEAAVGEAVYSAEHSSEYAAGSAVFLSFGGNCGVFHVFFVECWFSGSEEWTILFGVVVLIVANELVLEFDI